MERTDRRDYNTETGPLGISYPSKFRFSVMYLMRTMSEKAALAAIIPDRHVIRIDAMPANAPHAWLRKKLPAMCGVQKSQFRSVAIRRR